MKGPDFRRSARRFHAALAFAILVLDALVLGQGTLALFAMVGTFLKAALGRERPRFWARSGIYAACFAATLGVLRLNDRIARSRAETVIAAVGAFQAKAGHYPDRLEELVPAYLPAVPPAKIAFAFAQFTYLKPPGEAPLLFYFGVPPFGRPTYSFAEARWSYLD